MANGPAEDELRPPLRGVVEVDWDGWEDPGGRSRAAIAVTVTLLVAAAVVVALVVWAVGTDAELPPDTTTTSEVAPAG
jgi:hypothetical protein